MKSSPSVETQMLIARAQRGDRTAEDQLFARYLARVRQLVSLRMGRRSLDIAELDDAVQETLLDAFRGLERFEPRSEGAFVNWLATLAENNLRDQARRARTRKREHVRTGMAHDSSVLTVSVLAGNVPTPSQVAQARETEARLERALLELPERQRRAVELRCLCGMDFGEIAEQLALGSESSARSLFSRAMGALSTRI